MTSIVNGQIMRDTKIGERFWPSPIQTQKPDQMKYLFTAAALCLGMLGAQAQTDNKMDTTSPAHNCVASTTDKDWASLGLSADQTTKVKSIQTESMKANDKMKADHMETKESPMMDKYEGEVKSVLTPEQYDKWVKWCTTRAAKPMDAKKTMEKN